MTTRNTFNTRCIQHFSDRQVFVVLYTLKTVLQNDMERRAVSLRQLDADKCLMITHCTKAERRCVTEDLSERQMSSRELALLLEIIFHVCHSVVYLYVRRTQAMWHALLSRLITLSHTPIRHDDDASSQDAMAMSMIHSTTYSMEKN